MKPLATFVVLFSVLAVSWTVLAWWDAAPEKSNGPKYRLGQNQDLGIITYEPITDIPKLWNFECVGSEKDCGKSQPETRIQSVPVPGTLWLVLVGLGALFYVRKTRR